MKDIEHPNWTQREKDAGYLEFLASEIENARMSLYLNPTTTARLLREMAQRIRNGGS